MKAECYHYEHIDGVEVFVIDVRSTTGEELVTRFEAVAAHVREKELKSVRSLTLAHGIEYSPQSTKAALALTKGNAPYILRSAIVGLEHLSGLINLINRLADRNIRAFSSVEDAQQWLISD